MRAFLSLLLVCYVANVAHAVARSSYAVVVSEKTFADAGWRPVVEALLKKHRAVLLKYDGEVDTVLPLLQDAFPKYTGFVARPEEAGREFVARIHVTTRQLDDDAYPDTFWGIVTGYEAADALRIASHDTPLVARRLLAGTVGSPLDQYDEGLMFSELKPNVMWRKSSDTVEEKECPTDTTKLIVEGLNNYAPDVFITSGHATERDWMPGYSYRNGVFKCEDGQLYGQDLAGRRFDVNSPNPKVHLPVGNCLIAHISARDCMALALMHSAGVYQMVGYTIPTGYGYGGWGVKDYFSELQAGRFTLTQAHFANQVATIYNLETRSPNVDDRALAGLRGDRDVVVLYGDPAWEARMPERHLPWSQTLTEESGEYTFTITCNERGDWDNRPIVHFFDERLTDIQITGGGQYQPIVMDDFILVKLNHGVVPMKGNRGETMSIRGDFEKNQQFVVKFTARKRT